MSGLHDHRHLDCGLAQPRQHTEPVEVGHDQIEDDAIDVGTVGAGKQRQRRVAVVAHENRIAEFLQHAFEQAALHRIVVDDEDGHTLFPCG